MCDNFEYWNTTNCIECAPNQKIYGIITWIFVIFLCIFILLGCCKLCCTFILSIIIGIIRTICNKEWSNILSTSILVFEIFLLIASIIIIKEELPIMINIYNNKKIET